MEQLLPFIGQVIVWSPDGARLLDGAADLKTLSKQLSAGGEDPSLVVFEYLSAF
jgi:hypothetical protein